MDSVHLEKKEEVFFCVFMKMLKACAFQILGAVSPLSERESPDLPTRWRYTHKGLTGQNYLLILPEHIVSVPAVGTIVES